MLKNPHAAAKEWELAGDVEKAVAIFVQLDDQLAAGDLLRRVGEPERALLYYRSAAERLAARSKFLEAGNLFGKHAHRLDLAVEMYERGWSERPLVTGLPCGVALARIHANEPDVPRFLRLIDDGEDCADDWAGESTAQFFNELARLSRENPLSVVAEEVKDRCLLTLARSMELGDADVRRGASPGLFFPPDAPWSAPLVRDAEFALKHRKKIAVVASEPKLIAEFGPSTVRAVCWMPVSSTLFLGFENGEVIRHSPISGESVTLTKLPMSIHGLVADRDENKLMVLASTPNMGHVLLASRSRQFRIEGYLQTRVDSPAILCARVENQDSPYFAFLHGEQVTLFCLDNSSGTRVFVPVSGMRPRAGIVGATIKGTPWFLLFFDDGARIFFDDFKAGFKFGVDDLPANPSRNTLNQPPLQAFHASDQIITVRWVGKDGRVYELDIEPHRGSEIADNFSGAWCDTMKRPSLGIFDGAFDRDRSAKRESIWDLIGDEWHADQSLFNPVAIFFLTTNRVLIVNANGSLTRVPVQRQ